MSQHTHTPAWWAAARQQGLLQGDPPPDDAPSPWLIGVLMLGALLCALPVLATLYLLLEDAWLGPGGWVMAFGLMAVSVGVLLHHRPIFVTCLAVVGVMVAALWLGLLVTDVRGRHNDLLQLAALELALALVCAALVQPRWVQQAAGFVVALWLALLVASPFESNDALMFAVSLSAAAVLAAAWALWVWREAGTLGRAEAARWSALADGLAVGVLAIVRMCSWDTHVGWAHSEAKLPLWLVEGLMRWPCVLVPFAGAALARRWREQGAGAVDADAAQAVELQRWIWGVAALLTGLSACVPGLAVVSVLAALAAATARWRLLAACGVAALVCLSRFYFNLSWPLTTKAAVLAAAGLALGLALWLGHARSRQSAAGSGLVQPADGASAAPGTWRWAAPLIGLLGVLCLLLINVDLWRKEAVVARGEAIYVPLVPVDPRSLMQGDYMDLRFDVPTPVVAALADMGERGQARVVVGLDAKQRGTVLRLAQPGEALAANERLMPLKRMRRGWSLVTDAYFFPEGQGKRFEAARYGEFRVLPDGRALLIGLSDAEARPIRSPHDLRD